MATLSECKIIVTSCACRTGTQEVPDEGDSESSNLSVTTIESDLHTDATETADVSGEPETTPEPPPESTLPLKYQRSTFIVARTSSDGFHSNYLTSYITALVTYCALTGNSAVGAEWSYVSTSMRDYILNTSNYDLVLTSKVDMVGIQKVIDEYIA